MKYYSVVIALLIFVAACNSGTQVKEEQTEENNASENAVDATQLTSLFEESNKVEVSELKAMAKDDGKSEAEISLIIEPKYEYSFVADGVIIQ